MANPDGRSAQPRTAWATRPLGFRRDQISSESIPKTGATGPESTNFILVPLVCDMLDVPVVAAGGIADRRGYRAAMALGAEGVQVGTAFLASEESPASRSWKEAIIGCGDAGTTLPPIAGMAMRTIINPKLGELMASGADLNQEYNMGNAGEAWSSGNFDLFPAGGGQISALIDEIKPVGDIIEELVS